MQLQCDTQEVDYYLQASEIIDFENKEIQEVAQEISLRCNTDVDLAKAAYEFVRDNISHSWDIKSNNITWKASSVLKHKEGLCFAKSHLLAAILRYLKIPTGFCYQRLIFDDSDPTYCSLHGLNGIYLPSRKRWIRVDARGNKERVSAQFSLEQEKLAFPVRQHLSEIDYSTIYPQPNPKVIAALRSYQQLPELINNLPQDL